MGPILDCAEDLRQDKKSPSWKAHQAEKKLAKNKIEGVKMAKESVTPIRSPDLDLIVLGGIGDTAIPAKVPFCDGKYVANDLRRRGKVVAVVVTSANGSAIPDQVRERITNFYQELGFTGQIRYEQQNG